MNQKIEQHNQNVNQLRTEIQDMKEKINRMKASIENFYPFGSIYMSVIETNPESLFGGRWQKWGQGRVPVGVSQSGTFSAVEKTGGDERVTLTESEIPRHR